MFFRHRYRVATVFEILFSPIFCLLIFLALTRGVTWKKVVYERSSPEIQLPDITEEDLFLTFLDDKIAYNADDAGRLKLIYSPRHPFTDELMQRAIDRIGVGEKNECNGRDVHRGFGCAGVDSITEVMELCMFHRLDTDTHGKPIAVIFNLNNTKWSDEADLPFHLRVTISTFHPELADTQSSHPFVRPPNNEHWESPYHKFGFLGLQVAIEDSFMEMVYNKTHTNVEKNLTSGTSSKSHLQMAVDICTLKRAQVNPSVVNRLLRVRYVPQYYDASSRRLIISVVIITLVLSYTSISYFIVRQIVIETQSKIKDLLQMHSLPYHYHWIILFTQAFLFRAFTAAGVAGALFMDYGFGAILTHSRYLPIFFILWAHLISLSCFNFFLATTLSSIMFSGVYGISVCILMYVMPATLARSDFIGFTPNLILCLLSPNWTLYNFVALLIELECDEEGISWKNFDQRSSHTVTSHLGFVELLVILLISAVVYLTLAILNDMSNQKRLESDLKWYQCIEKCKRRFRKSKSRKTSSVAPADTDASMDDNFKRPAMYENKGVEAEKCLVYVRNLSKLYGKHRLVLDNISMNFAQGEITVCLGHTDAGKSTLIQCLAGMVPPTTGVAMINGFNVTTESKKARQYLGLCPQEVITFNFLTVHQHMTLCYKLRGLSNEDANRESGQLTKLLRLHEVRHNVPSEITNDEKRKLGIAMCLVDSPTVILLDEPTIGMSVLEKREIWQILKDLKKDGHAIILTTNMMDEVEVLADRIAVLTHGKLMCYGTPAYLKQQHDTGYILRITPAFKLFIGKVIAIGRKHIGESFKERKEKTVQDKDVVLIDLPKSEVFKFPALLDEIEEQKYHLGIASYEVQQVSLADVFIKVSENVTDIHEFVPGVYERKNLKTGECVEECTKVATRLLVLSEGNVQCTGTPADLKERFSKDFFLLVRIKYDTLSPLEIVSSTVGRAVEVKKTIENKFRHATLRHEQDVFLLYFLRDTTLTWGEAFRKAEEIKAQHEQIIESYFISKASLEDIFVLLTNKYRELDKPRRMEPSLPAELTKYEAEKAAFDEAAKKLKF